MPRLRLVALVWALGMLGVPFLLLDLPHVLPPDFDPGMPWSRFLALLVLFEAGALGCTAFLGAALNPRLESRRPLQRGFRFVGGEAWLRGTDPRPAVRPAVVVGLATGAVGGLVCLALTPGFVAYLGRYSLGFRLVWGGITEELYFRWGLQSLLVWGAWRLLQPDEPEAPPEAIRRGVFLTALVFSAMHVPALQAAGVASPVLVCALLFPVALPWGFLFARMGLESCMAAHAGFHLTVWVLAG